MAYVAFDEPVFFPASPPARLTGPGAVTGGDAGAPPVARLSALEWSVVAMARGDRLSSLRRPGRTASALRVVFRRHNPMLADERLEALRRMAVLAWHRGYAVPGSEVKRFVAAGYTIDQYELLMASIAAGRQRRGAPRHARATGAVTA